MTEVFHRARLGVVPKHEMPSSQRSERWYQTPEGNRYPSVTTILGVENKKALNTWKVKQTLRWAKNNPGTMTELPIEQLEKMAYDIPNLGNSSAASGEIVHRIFEELALGRDAHVPEGFESAADAWRRFNEDFEVEVIAVEPEVYNDTMQYAGSLDALYRMRARGDWYVYSGEGTNWGEWQTVVADVKSGNGLYGSTAIQCMAYGKAEKLIMPGEGVIDMPEVTAIAGIWVRPGGYAFYPLEFSERVWRHFAALRRVHLLHNADWQLRGKAINPNAVKSAGSAWPDVIN